MYTHFTQVRVRFAETDHLGFVYHGNYLLFFEAARSESLRNLGWSYAEMEKEGVMLPTLEVQLKYLKPNFYDDLLNIKTIIKEMPNGTRFFFEQEVYNEKKELTTLGKITLVFVDTKTKRPTSMPEKLRACLEKEIKV